MLNYEFPPLGGGTANANWYLLKEYSKIKDLEIDLVVSSSSIHKIEQFSDRIKVHYLDIGKNNNNLQYQSYKDVFIYGYKSLFYCWKLRLANNYDLVHAFYGMPCGVVAMLLFKPYIVSLRGSDVPFYSKRFNLLDKYFLVHVNKLVWSRAKYVVANSDDLKKLALKTTPNLDIKVIPNGVDTDFYKPDKRIKKEKTILFVGRLIPRKRVDILISAFAKLPENLSKDWKVWVVGDGPERTNLKYLARKLRIEKKVRFFGHLDKNKLRKIYQKASVYVLASKNEGMSNTVLEAMACGLPVLVTDTGDASKFLKSKYQLFSKQYDLVSLLNKTLSHESDRVKLALRSRSIITEMKWSTAAENYSKIYKEIC